MRASKNFELHVTLLDGRYPDEPGWTRSKIDGDPALGAGVKCYRTSHTSTYKEAVTRIEEAKRRWPTWIRTKIEHVLLDCRK